MDPNRRYFFPVVGYNYRLTNLACALLCAQLERFEVLAGARVRICEAYQAALADVPGIGFQGRAAWASPAKWLFCITVDEATFGRSRDELATVLDQQGIETRPFFHPLHRLPPYVDAPGAQRPLPVTERLGESGMNLPTFSGMTAADIDRVVDAVRSARR
jgi:perosamine synthetase